MEWSAAVEGWLLALRAAGRPASTVGLRSYQLRRVAAAMPCGPWEVTGADLTAWIGSQRWARETLRSMRAALRSFYGWAHGLHLVEVDPSRALLPVKPSDPNPRPAPEAAYRLALARGDARVRLMVDLAATLGMRRGEVARVHARDLEEDLAGWTLVVHGKGGKIRRLPLEDGMAVRVRRATESGGWAFPGAVEGHLSPAWVGKLVSRELPGAWAMHSLRHRAASVAYSIEHDIVSVQEMLGHASLVTTRLYVRTPDDALRRMLAAVAAV